MNLFLSGTLPTPLGFPLCPILQVLSAVNSAFFKEDKHSVGLFFFFKMYWCFKFIVSVAYSCCQDSPRIQISQYSPSLHREQGQPAVENLHNSSLWVCQGWTRWKEFSTFRWQQWGPCSSSESRGLQTLSALGARWLQVAEWAMEKACLSGF